MKKKRGGSGGANWMDTYGDMVTLLLCFFVMLYSMSSINEEKWMALVEALNPNSEPENIGMPVSTDSSAPTPALTQEQVDADIEALYQAMKDYVDQENLNSQISISKGSGYVFITFDDTVFFAGDSYELLDAGEEILDQIAKSIGEVSESIDEIQVLGHTAQAVANAPNPVTADRFLATNRASVVTVYLQEKNVIDPARLVSVGYGQWRPVSDNQTSEGRAKNRRVELLVTGLDVSSGLGDDIVQYYTMRSGEDGTVASSSWEDQTTETGSGQEE